MHQSQLVSLSPSCSTAFSVLCHGVSTYLFFCFLCFFYSGGSWNGKIHYMTSSLFFFFLLIITRSGLVAKIVYPTKLCLVSCSFCTSLLHLLTMQFNILSFSPHNVDCCALLILALISSWSCADSIDFAVSLSLSLPIHPYNPSLLACLPNYFLYLYRADVNCCSCWLANTNMSTWRGPWKNVTHEFVLTSPAWSQMFCFLLQLGDIKFLSLVFSFIIMPRPSHVRFCQFVAWNIPTVVFLPISVS